ncbi:MAG: hypothetical protein CBD18_05010 [Opitutales bacterium TMED158]|nr:MAG: hypothetical protein CBD18_05010 [Opitutales bacterium TMED158]
MIASTKVTEHAENRWTLIVERFRNACILYREGCNIESRRIIKDELPELIRAWIKLLPPSLKEDAKADLRDMFTREQSIVDQGLKLQNIFKDTLVKNIIPQVEEQVAAKYRTLYVKEHERRKAQRETEIRDPWRSLGTPVPVQSQPGPKKRIGIDDVQGMIDAVQEEEGQNEAIANSVLSLDQIVTTLNQANVEPLLAEENAISI